MANPRTRTPPATAKPRSEIGFLGFRTIHPFASEDAEEWDETPSEVKFATYAGGNPSTD
jgi:hypothetical protein